jgi:hypothetical protein
MLWLLVTLWHPLHGIQIKHASLLMKVINLQNLLWYCDCTCPPILKCIALSKVKCLMWKLRGNEVKWFLSILHVSYFPLNSFTWPLHTKDMDLHFTLKMISHWSNYFTSWTLTLFWLKLHTPTCKCITTLTSHVWMFIINPTHAQC